LSRRLAQTTSSGPFQPQPLWDSVKTTVLLDKFRNAKRSLESPMIAKGCRRKQKLVLSHSDVLLGCYERAGRNTVLNYDEISSEKEGQVGFLEQDDKAIAK